VHEEEVQIVEPEVAQTRGAGNEDIAVAMPVVPDLGGDPEFLAPHGSAGKNLTEHCADLTLVPVDGRAVDVPVAYGNGPFDGLGDGHPVVVVGGEGPETQNRDPRAVRQLLEGHEGWIDAVGGDGKHDGLVRAHGRHPWLSLSSSSKTTATLPHLPAAMRA
jgi:hypothetical protein